MREALWLVYQCHGTYTTIMETNANIDKGYNGPLMEREWYLILYIIVVGKIPLYSLLHAVKQI